jgi:hypothetical protein
MDVTSYALGPNYNSQHFIFLVNNDWVQWAWALDYAREEGLISDEHSSLFRPFVSCGENEVSTSHE